MFFSKNFAMSGLILISILCTQHAIAIHFLHLSFHKGCLNEINMIAGQLGFEVTSLFIPDLAPQAFDGYSSGNALYNIGHDRALNIWNKHKNYFNQFDGIITSDTAPLSRIFLQNNYEKPLIIWVCNRFNYVDNGSLDCDFPDEEYYQLLRQAINKKNIYIIPYTAFESFYAAEKNVLFNHEVIQPSGICIAENKISVIPPNIDKAHTFFIPPYLNDMIIPIEQLQVPTYYGRYNGPTDLQDFKGIIHIPYAWSNVAFFENMQHGLPYFVPSISFLLWMYHASNIWWATGNYLQDNYHLSEWYNAENSEIITYFDSWDDLQYKIASTDFDSLKTKIKTFAQTHKVTTINKWKSIIDNIKESS